MTTCTGSWVRERLLGESDPYIRVLHCSGCKDRMVIDGSRLAFMEPDPLTSDQDVIRRVFTERPR